MMRAHWKKPSDAYYTCNAKAIISGEEKNITKASGKHMKGKTDSWVKSLIVNQQGLKKIPDNLHVFFKKLSLVEMQSNEITDISRTDIEVFTNLTY